MKYAAEMGSGAMMKIPGFLRLVQALNANAGQSYTDSVKIANA
jgi:hypothetical protein